MAKNTLYNKIIDSHTVEILDDGRRQIFVDRHPMHDATSAPAFGMLREKGLSVRNPGLTFAVCDHVFPTDNCGRPFLDSQDELLIKTLEKNAVEFGVRYFGTGFGRGVCHVVYPEKGIILPGMVVVCGDSHTSTYGAFGTLAFGVGSTQVAHVLATQTFAMDKDLKVRKIEYFGGLGSGVVSKDLALYTIRILGVDGGNGYAYEYTGNVIDKMNLEARMTLCNLSIEGGAKSGYINPDNITYEYLKERKFAPKDISKAIEYWETFRSGTDAVYDDIKEIDVNGLSPVVTWGVNPGQAIMINEKMPELGEFIGDEKKKVEDAYSYMGLVPGEMLCGTSIDKVFIGSCTNGRLNDLRQAAMILKNKRVKVPTLIVPGSELVREVAEKEGLDRIFIEAGALWRYAGCSMCLSMNPDKLIGYERCASTSNRNFKGRQGSKTGRTHLMSPYSAAAAAIVGRIVDPRDYIL